MSRRKVLAFTLIEVLIVVVIIAILATVIVIGVSGVGKRTRDDRRISDAHAVATALDQYATEHKRKFPTFTVLATYCSGDYCYLQTTNGPLQNALKDYISPLPVDPSNAKDATFRYVYIYNKTTSLQGAVVVDKFERGRNGCNIPGTGSVSNLPVAVTAYITLKGGDRPCYYVSR